MRKQPERTFEFPSGETITESDARRWYERERAHYVVRLWTRRLAFGRSRRRFFFRACPECLSWFQPHKGHPPLGGTDAELDPTVSPFSSRATCPHCGTRWPYDNFDRWLNYAGRRAQQELDEKRDEELRGDVAEENRKRLREAHEARSTEQQ